MDEQTGGTVDGAKAFLDVRDLRIHFPTDDGLVKSVDGLTFRLERGRTLGIVGESGSGKSVTSLGILGLHNRRNAQVSGEIWLDGTELVSASPEDVRRLRGREMSMIFQDPLSSMHPHYTVGNQIIEAILLHQPVSRRDARAMTIEMLRRVGVSSPEQRVDQLSNQLSEGLRQRAMIAMALSCQPDVLIADEPTTALDVTIQAQILERIEDLREQANAGVILVTHDLGVVADIADRIAVMYAGRIVETGTLDEIFYDPQHPYTWGLLGSIPRVDRPRPERLPAIAGLPPSLLARPEGCDFRPRCPHEFGQCPQDPALEARLSGSPGHHDRCWLPPEQKQERRVVAGQIGLEAKGARA